MKIKKGIIWLCLVMFFILMANRSAVPPGYHPYGCFKKENEGSFSPPVFLLGGVGKVENSRAETQRCANAARKSRHEAFGLQEHAECYGWRSVTLVHILERVNNCNDGLGKKNSYFIYIFNKYNKHCPSGFVCIGNLTKCQPCPVDQYKQNNIKCKPCESGKKTWGRKGVATAELCTAENPIKVSNLEVSIAPDEIKPGLIVANFTANYEQNSSVNIPLTYAMTNVTKSSSQTQAPDITSGYIYVCSQPASKSLLPFCIYRDNGSIAINKNFNCSKGDKFVISINVSDSGSDTIGTIVNPDGRVTIKCVQCKEVRPLYEKSRNACSKPVQINDSNMVVVNSSNIYSINKIYVTNITGNSCRAFNVSMTHGLINVTTNIVGFRNLDGHTSVRSEYPITVTGPAINITLHSSNCIESASLTLVTVPKHPESCVGRWNCLDAVFNWTNSMNIGQCGSDPDNLRIRYGHCVVKPQITSGPESKSVPSGTQVTLVCEVSSSLPANITWYRGANEIVTNPVTMDVHNQGYYYK